MNKKRLGATVASLALVGVIGIGSTLAYFTDRDEETNVITMGHVDIDLDEPIFSGTHENNTITNVVPNQTIVKDPTITLKADSESAYLRAKIEVKGLSDEQVKQLMENINIQEGWELSDDGYYYFQTAVGKTSIDQKFVLFNEVKIPEKWGNEVTKAEFTIDVTAEAIQAENFEPTRVDGKIVAWTYENGEAVTAETYRLK